MVQQWLEHPVTKDLQRFMEAREDELSLLTMEVFYPGDPQRTYDELAGLQHKAAEIQNLLDKLNELGQLDEHEWNDPFRLSHFGEAGPDRGNDGGRDRTPTH